MFFCEFCEISKKTFFHRTPLVATSANLPKGGNFWFFYRFKPFSILNFAMAEWFCHITCFCGTFFSRTNMIFLSQKVVTWKLQHFYHFYHKEVMLSFLHRWDHCWKCEFDTDVKIKHYNHHDGGHLIYYKRDIPNQSKKKNVLVISILLLYNIARNEEFHFIW